MPRYCLRFLVGCCVVCCVTVAQAQVWFVNTSGSVGSNKVNLTGLGVHRGAQSFSYDFDELILGNVTAVNIPGPFRTVVLSPDGYPAAGAPSGLLNDPVLNSGLLDPGRGNGTFQRGDEFTEYTFTQPVQNGPGPDLLLSFITYNFGAFETDPGPYWLMPAGGAPTFIDRPADMDLSSVPTIPYYLYLDGGPTDPSDFLATNVQLTGGLGNSNAAARPSLQTIDLGDLGVLPGEWITSLRIWDDDFSNGNEIYPTLIAGLPTVPEPSSLALAAFGVMALIGVWRRQRSR